MPVCCGEAHLDLIDIFLVCDRGKSGEVAARETVEDNGVAYLDGRSFILFASFTSYAVRVRFLGYVLHCTTVIAG